MGISTLHANHDTMKEESSPIEFKHYSSSAQVFFSHSSSWNSTLKTTPFYSFFFWDAIVTCGMSFISHQPMSLKQAPLLQPPCFSFLTKRRISAIFCIDKEAKKHNYNRFKNHPIFASREYFCVWHTATFDLRDDIFFLAKRDDIILVELEASTI